MTGIDRVSGSASVRVAWKPFTPRHDDVHEDQVGVQFAREACRALRAVGGRGGVEAVLLERLLHDVHVGRGVVDDQYECQRSSVLRFSISDARALSIALSSSSRVKGLVR